MLQAQHSQAKVRPGLARSTGLTSRPAGAGLIDGCEDTGSGSDGANSKFGVLIALAATVGR